MEGDRCPLGCPGDTNQASACSIQDLVKKDITPPRSLGPVVFHLRTLHRYSLLLQSNPAPLLDVPLQKALEDSGSLNWCPTEATLYALKSTEWENSLLDAVAMSMWGVPDRDLALRTALYNTAAYGSPADLCLEGNCEWSVGGQSQLSSDAWGHVVRPLQPEAKQQPPGLNPYLPVHLFLLSNVIRRPIVVLGGSAEDTKVTAVGGGLKRGPVGVYLPLLWDAADCHPYPVVLGGISPWRHFAPLVTDSSHQDTKAGLPLACCLPEEAPRELPLHFPPDGDVKHWLRTYLQITDSHLGRYTVQVARLNALHLPEHVSLNQGGDCPQSTCTLLPHPPPSSSSSRSLSVVTKTCVMTHCHSSPSDSTSTRCYRFAALQHLDKNCKTGRLPQSILGADHPEGRGCLSVENSISSRPCELQLPTGPNSAPSHLLQNTISHNSEEPKRPTCTNFIQKKPMEAKQVPQSIETSDFLCGRCVSCKLEIRTFNGLCFQCLQSRTTPSTGTHTVSGPLLSLTLPRMQAPPMGTERCRTPQCIYFGTPQHLGYCSLCYCSQDAAQTAPPPSSSSSSLQLSSRLRDLPRCATPGCHMLGTPSFRGLCERCHLSSRYTSYTPVAPPADWQEKPSKT